LVFKIRRVITNFLGVILTPKDCLQNTDQAHVTRCWDLDLFNVILPLEAVSRNRFRFLSCSSREHPVRATSSTESRAFTDQQHTFTHILVSLFVFAASTISTYGQGTLKTAVKFSTAIKTQRTVW